MQLSIFFDQLRAAWNELAPRRRLLVPATLSAAGITTPQPAMLTFAQAPNNNNAMLSSTTSGGAVTLNAWQAILGATTTPVAATTTVATQYRVCGK